MRSLLTHSNGSDPGGSIARETTRDSDIGRVDALCANDPAKKPLTARQLNVLLGAAEGKTSKEMADQLGIAEKTVESTRSRAMRCLGARNFAHAIALAMRAGFIR